VKRTTDKPKIPLDVGSAVRFTDSLITTSRDPTDESVGYFHSSASPTFAAKPPLTNP